MSKRTKPEQDREDGETEEGDEAHGQWTAGSSQRRRRDLVRSSSPRCTNCVEGFFSRLIMSLGMNGRLFVLICLLPGRIL
jgi:hypothetical protein